MLLEFTDYQCPFCARHVRNTAGRIDAEYVQTGKLRYTLRDFPLESIHPQAFKAAEAAHCAGEQARYWEMHGQLFANQGKLGAEDLAAHAQAVGLDVARMTACLEAGRYAARVRQGLADGEQAGVRGTPTFFLGEIEADGAGIKPLAVLRGAQPFSAFKAAIDSALAASR